MHETLVCLMTLLALSAKEEQDVVHIAYLFADK